MRCGLTRCIPGRIFPAGPCMPWRCSCCRPCHRSGGHSDQHTTYASFLPQHFSPLLTLRQNHLTVSSSTQFTNSPRRRVPSPRSNCGKLSISPQPQPHLSHTSSVLYRQRPPRCPPSCIFSNTHYYRQLTPFPSTYYARDSSSHNLCPPL